MILRWFLMFLGVFFVVLGAFCGFLWPSVQDEMFQDNVFGLV